VRLLEGSFEIARSQTSFLGLSIVSFFAAAWPFFTMMMWTKIGINGSFEHYIVLTAMHLLRLS